MLLTLNSVQIRSSLWHVLYNYHNAILIATYVSSLRVVAVLVLLQTRADKRVNNSYKQILRFKDIYYNDIAYLPINLPIAHVCILIINIKLYYFPEQKTVKL